MSERRDRQRIKVELPCNCVAFGYPQASFRATIENIGPNGFALTCPVELATNQEVEIYIDLKDQKLIFKTKVVQCEVSKITKQSYVRVKIFYTSIEDEKKYIAFYQKHLLSQPLDQ